MVLAIMRSIFTSLAPTWFSIKHIVREAKEGSNPFSFMLGYGYGMNWGERTLLYAGLYGAGSSSNGYVSFTIW